MDDISKMVEKGSVLAYFELQLFGELHKLPLSMSSSWNTSQSAISNNKHCSPHDGSPRPSRVAIIYFSTR